MIPFFSNFNVNTTVEHFLNVFQELHTATNENGNWENWLISYPIRGDLHGLVSYAGEPTIYDDGVESLQHPYYYYAPLKRKSSEGFLDVPGTIAYKFFLEEIASQHLHVRLVVTGALVVTDFLASTLTYRLLTRYPECTIDADYKQWLEDCSTPELIASALVRYAKERSLDAGGAFLLEVRKPFANKRVRGSEDTAVPKQPEPAVEKEQKNRQKLDSDHYAYPDPKKRRAIVKHYQQEKAVGNVSNKNAWAQSNYQISGRTLRNYEKEFSET
ncbi:MAG: hypothetical protein KC421_09110 [Anaerolineales bacterium]|nr:hypothetical protein [Anaerolineales bacterium]